MTYILADDGNPEACDDIEVWARWFATADRHVQETYVGKVRVSTVFVGIDHNFGKGTPLLWQTMIFGGVHNGGGKRYASAGDALTGHASFVALLG